MHVCPLCSGTVPHVGGPVAGPGASNVMINGKAAALLGDLCTCMGPPDTIVMGQSNVRINGKPVACQGDMTAHGGAVTMGESNVTISSSSQEPSVMLPVREIPFPKVTTMGKVAAAFSGNYEQLKKAESTMEELRGGAKEHGFLADYSFSA